MYGQKKSRESNWQFDSRPLKVENRPDFLTCRWHATYHWKTGQGLQSKVISIKGLHIKLWGPKVARVPTLGISKRPFGSPGTKCHLDVGLVKRHKVYYKGEGGDFPQVWVVVSLVSPSLPVAHPSTKSAQTMHYLTCSLVCVGLCEELKLFTLPSPHLRAPTRPSTLKCCELGSVP
jgi:hypothetical protein